MADLIPYVVAAGLTVCLTLLLYFKHTFAYWKSRGVYTLPPSIPFGNGKDFFLRKMCLGDYLRNLHFHIKSRGLKFGGFYMGTSPDLLVTDLGLVKSIVQTDYSHFASHGLYVDEKVDPLSGHLFSLEGSKWRKMRTKLTPTFTSGKMKMMFETFVACTEGLKDLVDEVSKNDTPLDTKDTLGRFTTDIIGSCAFGLECNSMKDPDAEFRKYGKMIFESTLRGAFTRLILRFLPAFVAHHLKIKVTKPKVEKFFMKAVKDTVEYREKNNVYRKDFMHLLLQLKNRGKVSDDTDIFGEEKGESSLTIEELAAQCYVFFIAGFETSSTAMSFALYELATNQNIQEKLRKEINEVLRKHDGKLTYEAVKDMEYLDRVLQETLRLHPPVVVLPRACTKSYKIPGTDVTIEPDIKLWISNLAIHTDPEYYPDPEVFDPERFTEENKAKRPQFTYLPFGEGPRICIGMRFGILQSKVGLITLIKNYKITLNNKTITPLQYNPRSTLIGEVKGGIWVDVKKIQ